MEKVPHTDINAVAALFPLMKGCDGYSNYSSTTSLGRGVAAGFVKRLLKISEPASPARQPPNTASPSAISTLTGELKANGASSPGIGEAVPGALLMIPKAAAAIPASPPPTKFEQYIGTG